MGYHKQRFVPIAIIGIGGIFPDSEGPESFWRQLLTGKDFMKDVPNVNTHWLRDDYFSTNMTEEEKTYIKKMAFIPEINFNPVEFGIPPQTIQTTDTAQLLTLVAVKQLLMDTFGENWKENNFENTSVIIGTSVLNLLAQMAGRLQKPHQREALMALGFSKEDIEKISNKISEQYTPWTENTFPGLLSNVVAGRVCNRFNMRGTNCTVDAACAGSLAAISMAVDELQLGRSNLCITGGVDLLNDILMVMCFTRTGALSFSGECRPFSDKADGTMLGEAICLYMMKRLEDAEKDNNKIYAVIHGIGSSSDGRSKSIYAPTSLGQKLAIERAYAAADYSIETIGLFEAHGTATKTGDVVEIEGLKSALSSSIVKSKIPIGSIKSQVGHTKSASGAVSIFKTIMAMINKVLPASIKVDSPNPKIDENTSFYINTKLRPWLTHTDIPRRVGISSFGFGGSNYHITLQEYTGKNAAKRYRAFSSEVYLLGSEKREEMIEKIKSILNREMSDREWLPLILESQQKFNAKSPLRLSIVSSDSNDFLKKIKLAFDHLKKSDNFSLENIYCSNKTYEKIVFLFPGQGSQYLYMGSTLAAHFSIYHDVWQQATHLPLNPTIDQVVFPIAEFSNEKKMALEHQLQQSHFAQVALSTACVAQLKLFEKFGIYPNVTAGHSFGETIALYAAGIIEDIDSLQKLSYFRGKAMGMDMKKQGAMTAVIHPADDIINKFKAWNIPLVIANYNGPMQIVFSGEIEHIKKLEQLLTENNISFVRLKTSNAFHSHLIKESSDHFRKYVMEMNLRQPKIPIYSNTTGEIYPEDIEEIKKLFSNQFIHPVKFHQEIESIYRAGGNVFIEVGPGDVLTKLVKAILGDRHYLAVNSNNKNENDVTTFWKCLAQLSVYGIAVNFSSIMDDYQLDSSNHSDKSGLNIKLQGFNYNRPYPKYEKTKFSEEQEIMEENPFFKEEASQEMPIAPPLDIHEKSELLAKKEKFIPTEIRHTDYLDTKNTPSTKLTNAMLNIVADKTGYPVDSLKMDMALEEDLGIDSIKRVEILATLQNQIAHLPKLDPVELSSLLTLQEIANYIQKKLTIESTPSVEEKIDSPVESLPMEPSAISTDHVALPKKDHVDIESLTKEILDIVSDKTGYPVDSLKMDMALEEDLGIDSIKRVEILATLQNQIAHLPKLDPVELSSLLTLQEIANYIQKKTMSNEHHTNNIPIKPISENVGHYEVGIIHCPIPNKITPHLNEKKLEIVGNNKNIGEILCQMLNKSGIQSSQVEEPSGFENILDLSLLNEFSSIEEAITENQKTFLRAKKASTFFSNKKMTYIIVESLDGQFGMSGKIDEKRVWASGSSGLIKTAAQEWESAYVKIIDIEMKDQAPSSIAEILHRELLFGGDFYQEIGLSHHQRVTTICKKAEFHGTESTIQSSDVIVVTGGARGITASCLTSLCQRSKPILILLGRTPLTDESYDLFSNESEEAIKKKLIAQHIQSKIPIDPKKINKQAKEIYCALDVKMTIKKLTDLGVKVAYFPVNIQESESVKSTFSKIHQQFGPIHGLIHGAGVIEDKLIENKTVEGFQRVFNTKVKGLYFLLEEIKNDPIKIIFLFSSISARMGNRGQSDYAMANEVMNKVAQYENRRRQGNCLVKSINWWPWQSGMVTPELAIRFKERGIEPIALLDGVNAFVSEINGCYGKSVEMVIGYSNLQEKIMEDNCIADKTEFSLSPEKDLYLFDHIIKDQPVLPMVSVLEWFYEVLTKKYRAEEIRLNLINVKKSIILNKFDKKVIFFVEHDSSNQSLTLSDSNNTVFYTAKYEIVKELIPLLVSLDKTKLKEPPISIEKIYNERIIFHGTSFHSIVSLDQMSEHGIIGTLRKNEDIPGKIRLFSKILDQTLMDGGLQLAAIWIGIFLGKKGAPMSIEQFAYLSLPVIDHRGVTCTLSAEIANDMHCNFNVEFSVDGTQIAYIKKLSVICYERL
ncbi:MAG: hypothetical protein A3F10_06520 [Coxiella sp. RIFCSPHIGHO2_12_FULL_42_15]|nr:MAG: hypothetical protein A3F10_06520 [Coxiella sp. RIFCSPHIGHO2_12_FULL_42_15]